MRIIVLPDSAEGWTWLLIVLGALTGLAIGIAVWQRLWPSATRKLLDDDRYRLALAVYVHNLQPDKPTRDERRAALAVATNYLVSDHGIPAADAAPNMHLVVAAYDREQSYMLRNEAQAREVDGDFQSALTYYEGAARLQEEHDPKDYQFLQQCIDRVRRKAGCR